MNKSFFGYRNSNNCNQHVVNKNCNTNSECNNKIKENNYKCISYKFLN